MACKLQGLERLRPSNQQDRNSPTHRKTETETKNTIQKKEQCKSLQDQINEEETGKTPKKSSESNDSKADPKSRKTTREAQVSPEMYKDLEELKSKQTMMRNARTGSERCPGRN